MHDIPNITDEIKSIAWNENYFIFRLGTAIKPNKEIRTGNIYRNGRVWAAIDLLLTCDTIAEARDETKKRNNELDN